MGGGASSKKKEFSFALSTRSLVEDLCDCPVVGQGACATVYRKFDTALKRDVAIKCIKNSSLPGAQMRLEREISVLRHVDHPHIAKLYRVVSDATDTLLIMEYVVGGSLADIVKSNHVGISEDDARYYFRQILDAVCYCHKHGIVHRDLKPENILLTSQDEIKLIDFGLSRFYDGRPLQSICGTQAYFAPELSKQEKYDPVKVDVWALGVVLYMMVFGTYPFWGVTMDDMNGMIRNAAFDLPCAVTPDFESLLSRIFVVKPRKRCDFREIIDHPWVRWKDLSHSEANFSAHAPVDEGSLDLELMHTLTAMGFDPEEVKRSVVSASCSPESTAYHLLAAKRREWSASVGSPSRTPPSRAFASRTASPALTQPSPASTIPSSRSRSSLSMNSGSSAELRNSSLGRSPPSYGSPPREGLSLLGRSPPYSMSPPTPLRTLVDSAPVRLPPLPEASGKPAQAAGVPDAPWQLEQRRQQNEHYAAAFMRHVNESVHRREPGVKSCSLTHATDRKQSAAVEVTRPDRAKGQRRATVSGENSGHHR